jgi:hypothetical protein
MTCYVTVLSGIFNQGDLVCFAGNFHEQAILTGATGSSISANLRHQHGTGTWVMAKGPCGQFIDFTGNDVTVSNVALNFPYDIVGATNATTLQYAFFYEGVGNTPAPSGQAQLKTFSAVNLSNTGGVVTLSASGMFITNHPEMYTGETITITNSVDPTYNGPCTNAVVVPSSTFLLNCTQASSIGAGASATATISWGTTGFGNTAFVLRAGAGYGSVSPGNVTTILMEPNSANWAIPVSTTGTALIGSTALTVASGTGIAIGQIVTGAGIATGTTVANVAGTAVTLSLNTTAALPAGTPVTFSTGVIQPHHAAWHSSSMLGSATINNPTQLQSANQTYILSGGGTAGGTPGTDTGSGGSFANFAALVFQNNQPSTSYIGHGGLLAPPGGINLQNRGTNTGEFNYGLAMQFAPGPLGSAVIRVGCPIITGCTDYNYLYNVYRLDGNGAAGTLQYRPFFNELNFTSGNILFASNFAKTTFNDNVVGAALATPAQPTVTAFTSGGTLADATQFCYTIEADNTNGHTPQSTQACVTTGTSGNNNSIQVQAGRQQGVTFYRYCGRTSGAGTSLATNTGVDVTRWIDNGSATPGAACATTNTTLPGIDMMAYLELSDGTFWTKLLPNTMTGNLNLFLPKDLTSNLALVNEPTTATVVGDVATYNSVLGQVHDSGTLLSALAPLASPTFTGTPASVTPAATDNTTKIATTAFVRSVLLVASLTTTAATTDNVAITGMTSTGHCSLTATNSSAATNIATTFVSAKTTNQITVTHTATSGMTFDVLCTY